MSKWAVAWRATDEDDRNWLGVFLVDAVSVEESEGKAMRYLKHHYPEDDGWYDYIFVSINTSNSSIPPIGVD